MAFVPFSRTDFQAMQGVRKDTPHPGLEVKITELRKSLGRFPELEFEHFRKRIVRRPTMRGRNGLVFGPPKWYDQHWFLFNVGGDQDQVQLNIGMWSGHTRVGLGFMVGRQVKPKIPAFQLFQTFLGIRPPLPFRAAFFECIKRNGFQTEDDPTTDPSQVIQNLETQVIPADESPVFVFIGKLWETHEAITKQAEDYRAVFWELLPFYEELILAGGRYSFYLCE